MKKISAYLPMLDWIRTYNRHQLGNDSLASLIVMVMLIPQSLAYALLAGLPPEMGLYASILPLIVYAIFGSSRTLSVGPVAIISLMTAAAVGKLALEGSADYMMAAITLAFVTGLMLLIFGILKLGFLANFLSHPVISGFITASAVIIALSQLPNLLGISARGHNLLEIVPALFNSLTAANSELNIISVMIGLGTLVYLVWARVGLVGLMRKLGTSAETAIICSRLSPILAVIVTTALAFWFDLGAAGLALVGHVPSGLPDFSLPRFSLDLWQSLLGSAALIATIAFVESVSVAQGLAAKRRQRIDPDQELIALGTANMSSAFSGGFPVAGGFSRSVVNFDAGAATPAAGVYAAILIGVATFLFLPALAYLPKATLAATIIVAVWSLIDVPILKKAWRFSAADFMAVSVTIVLTLFFGVETGVAAGLIVSVLMHLYKTSKPHVAIVGQVPGSEQFRNIDRHMVETHAHILSIRIDESLYFANTRYLEDLIYKLIAEQHELKHVILMCNAVNDIDLSALESLEAINERLREVDIKLHFSEIKGPVMDRLQNSNFLLKLTGQVYLSQYLAVKNLSAPQQ